MAALLGVTALSGFSQWDSNKWYVIQNTNANHSLNRLYDNGTTKPIVTLNSTPIDYRAKWQIKSAGSGIWYVTSYRGLRLQDGNGGGDPALGTSTTTSSRAKWTISATGSEFYLTSTASDSKPRMRTDNTSIPEMTAKTTTDLGSKWEIVATDG